MFILDTNVVSEPIKPKADPFVCQWLDRQARETLYVTAINLAELLPGIACLPDGRRKRDLTAAMTELLDRVFGERILPFDPAAAEAFGILAGSLRSAGRQIPLADAQIAAIALAHGFSIATRDTGPFEAAGVSVINPWEER